MSVIDNKMSIEEAMVEFGHHGVKGMKWGTHKAKPSSEDIKGARARVGSQVRELNRQADKLNLAKDGSKAQDREAKKFAEMHASLLRNPDRATALRLTRGEKVGLTLLAVGIPGLGTAAAGGAVAGQVGVRKLVEREIRKAQAN